MSLLDRLDNQTAKDKEQSTSETSINNFPQTEAKEKIEIIEDLKGDVKEAFTEKEEEQTIKVPEDKATSFLKRVLDIHRKLINESDLDLNLFDIKNCTPEEKEKLSEVIKKHVLEIIERNNYYLSRQEKQEIIKAVIDETIGLGPIEALVKDESVTEIMVNGAHQIYMEQSGKIKLSDIVFYNDEHVRRIINRIVSEIGRHIDESMPMVDARLKDGSRVNAIIPPIALNGPTLTIRKFSANPYTAKDLILFNSLTPAMEEFLRACVEAKLNILVSGGTGSGKTTLLNVLSSFIPNNERIITIEDSAELKLSQEHVITMETRPPNTENTGEIVIRDLVRNSLRMRPDRLVVGEVRGEEALDMLQAMNTGHDGSMTTAHANSPRDMIARLETMVLMSGLELPVKAIRQQISSAFDIIVQQSRLQDGSRKIVSITEVGNMEEDIILLKDIFKYHQSGYNCKTNKIEGSFITTGLIPSFMDEIAANGIDLPNSIFNSQPG